MTAEITSLVRTRVQEACDRFYTQNGPCCAGCDWWSGASSVVGECRRSAPVPGHQRYALLGIGGNLPILAGHVLTPREHVCGEFKDEFDWSTLPPLYLRRIGRKLNGGVDLNRIGFNRAGVAE